MFKVIIVDDDILVLSRLKQIIGKNNNYEIVRDFNSPMEAISYLKDNEVHILITDMKMPKMNGIELIKEVKKINKNIEILAISSYDEFFFVKESLKEGSIDYILKNTLNEEVIFQALDSIKEKIIDKGKSIDKNIKNSMKELQEKATLKNNFLISFLYGVNSDENIDKKIEELDINLKNRDLSLIICEVDNYRLLSSAFNEEDKRIFSNSVIDIIERVLLNVKLKEIVHVKDGEYVIFLSLENYKSNLSLISSLNEYADKIKSNIYKIINQTVSISISNFCNGISGIRNSYLKAKNNLEDKLYEGSGRIYSDYKVNEVKNDKIERVEINDKEILSKLKGGDKEVLEYLNSLFKYYTGNKVPRGVIEINILELLSLANKVIKEYNLEIDYDKYKLRELFTNIHRYETLNDIREHIIIFFEIIIYKLSAKAEEGIDNYNKYTKNSIRYIEKKYKEAIGLKDASEELGVNYAYLSKIFKEDTGLNFIEYLNRYRIVKAKELIDSRKYTIKEIYKLVGFSSYNYFFKVFKQICDVTPAEYEKDKNL